MTDRESNVDTGDQAPRKLWTPAGERPLTPANVPGRYVPSLQLTDMNGNPVSGSIVPQPLSEKDEAWRAHLRAAFGEKAESIIGSVCSFAKGTDAQARMAWGIIHVEATDYYNAHQDAVPPREKLPPHPRSL